MTFDVTGISLNEAIPQGYGDNVTAAVMGSFGYGTEGGFTPNITVSYGPTAFNSPDICPFNSTDSCVFYWDTGYAGLTNVIGQANRGSNNGLIELVFTAAAGFAVQLNSLDLGSFGGTSRTINGVVVRDGSNNVLFSSGSLNLATSAVNVAPAVSATQLRLLIDASNLVGGDGELVALDNVVFSEISGVPEPSTFALMGAALGVVGWLRRRA